MSQKINNIYDYTTYFSAIFVSCYNFAIGSSFAALLYIAS